MQELRIIAMAFYQCQQIPNCDLKTFIKKHLRPIRFLKSNANEIVNYPYYIANQRFFGGAGIGIETAKIMQKFKLAADVGYFLDTDFGNFARLQLDGSYKIGNFTKIKFSTSYSTVPVSYNNYALLGLVYIFQ